MKEREREGKKIEREEESALQSVSWLSLGIGLRDNHHSQWKEERSREERSREERYREREKEKERNRTFSVDLFYSWYFALLLITFPLTPILVWPPGLLFSLSLSLSDLSLPFAPSTVVTIHKLSCILSLSLSFQVPGKEVWWQRKTRDMGRKLFSKQDKLYYRNIYCQSTVIYVSWCICVWMCHFFFLSISFSLFSFSLPFSLFPSLHDDEADDVDDHQ